MLSSKDKQAQPDMSQLDQRLAYLDQREQAIAMAERRTTVAASETRFISKHCVNGDRRWRLEGRLPRCESPVRLLWRPVVTPI